MLEIALTARWPGLHLDVKLHVGREPLLLVGPSGAGKTRLLLTVLGILRPERGRIRLGDRVLYDSEQAFDAPPEDRGIAYVPQEYALFPHLDVLRNTAYGLVSARPRIAKAERTDRARAVLERLDVGHLAHRYPDELSGGERQRVALARALAIEPRALVLDEPMAALDVGTRRQVRTFLSDRLGTLGIPSIVVTHDPADAAALGGTIAVMESGRIVQLGSLDAIAAAPATDFVHEFVALGRGARSPV